MTIGDWKFIKFVACPMRTLALHSDEKGIGTLIAPARANLFGPGELYDAILSEDGPEVTGAPDLPCHLKATVGLDVLAR